MEQKILEILKADMNGLTLDEIKKKVSGAGLAHMRQLCKNGLVRFDPAPSGGLYKALPAAWQ